MRNDVEVAVMKKTQLVPVKNTWGELTLVERARMSVEGVLGAKHKRLVVGAVVGAGIGGPVGGLVGAGMMLLSDQGHRVACVTLVVPGVGSVQLDLKV